jgi:hypothetical protein
MVSPSQDRARSYSFNQAQFMAGLKKYRLQVLAGALLVLALLLAVFGPEKETRISPATPTETVAGQEKVHSPAQAEAEKVPVVAVKEPKGAAKSVAPSSPPAEKSVAAQEGESLVPDAREGDSDVREALPERAVLPEPSAQPLAGEKTSISVSADVPAFPEPVAAEQQTEPALAIESVPEILSPPERKIVVLRADGRKRKVADGGEGKQSAARAAGDPEQLFAERLRASAQWQARAGYTIQLMALASDSAEESFKALLAQDRYKALQDQLYVVRKASPPTLFVYYGFFESMEKARQARDGFPDFLRQNQPYPLAIDRAAKKAGG